MWNFAVCKLRLHLVSNILNKAKTVVAILITLVVVETAVVGVFYLLQSIKQRLHSEASLLFVLVLLFKHNWKKRFYFFSIALVFN